MQINKTGDLLNAINMQKWETFPTWNPLSSLFKWNMNDRKPTEIKPFRCELA